MELKEETEKWLVRIVELIDKADAVDSRGEEFLKNINAYIADCRYFLGKSDFIRAFECVVHAWAVLETCRELDVLRIEDNVIT